MTVQICLVLFLFFSLNAFAQHEDTEQIETHYSGSTKHGTHFHPNHFAIFIGATTELEEDGIIINEIKDRLSLNNDEILTLKGNLNDTQSKYQELVSNN
jgi:hypothetical protein